MEIFNYRKNGALQILLTGSVAELWPSLFDSQSIIVENLENKTSIYLKVINVL